MERTLLGGYGPLYHVFDGTVLGPAYKLATPSERALASAIGVRYDPVPATRCHSHTAMPESVLARLHLHVCSTSMTR